jgi:hypothetical protein
MCVIKSGRREAVPEPVRLINRHQQMENGKDVEPGQRVWDGGDGPALRPHRNKSMFL